MGIPGSSEVKDLPAMQETRVWSLGWEDPLEKEIATHCSILAWEIPWREEPGRLQFMGLPRVGHDLVTKPPPNWYLNIKFHYFPMDFSAIINQPYESYFIKLIKYRRVFNKQIKIWSNCWNTSNLEDGWGMEKGKRLVKKVKKCLVWDNMICLKME